MVVHRRRCDGGAHSVRWACNNADTFPFIDVHFYTQPINSGLPIEPTVNPYKCLEDFLDDRVDLIAYERFMNFEIMAGGFLVRNTESSWQFFETFASYEFYDRPGVWDGYDNGALHVDTGR